MEFKECPKCGLYKPETAELCDCGYDYVQKAMRVPEISQAASPGAEAKGVGVTDPAATAGGDTRAAGPTPVKTKQGFIDAAWQKTALLTGFYWLFRWLIPSVLPASLRALKFQESVFMCAVGGFFFAGIASLINGPSSEERTKARADREAALRQAQIDHQVKKLMNSQPPAGREADLRQGRNGLQAEKPADPHGDMARIVPPSDTEMIQVPDYKAIFTKRSRRLAIGGGVMLALGLLWFGLTIHQSEFPIFALLLMVLGGVFGTLGVVFLIKPSYPTQTEVAAALEKAKTASRKPVGGSEVGSR